MEIKIESNAFMCFAVICIYGDWKRDYHVCTASHDFYKVFANVLFQKWWLKVLFVLLITVTQAHDASGFASSNVLMLFKNHFFWFRAAAFGVERQKTDLKLKAHSRHSNCLGGKGYDWAPSRLHPSALSPIILPFSAAVRLGRELAVHLIHVPDAHYVLHIDVPCVPVIELLRPSAAFWI